MKRVESSQIDTSSEQPASMTSAEKHCDPSAFFFSNKLENLELNHKTSSLFHAHTSFLAIGGENLPYSNENKCFIEHFERDNNRANIFARKGGEHDSGSDLCLAYPLHLSNGDFNRQIYTENDILSFQGQLQNNFEQDEKDLLFSKNLNGFSILDDKELVEVSKVEQVNRPSASTLCETSCVTDKDGYSSNGTMGLCQQDSDKVVNSKRTVSVHIYEDLSEQSNNGHSDHHTTHPLYSSEYEHLASVPLPVAVNTCNFQMNPFVVLPAASPSSHSEIAPQNSFSTVQSMLKANSSTNYSSGLTPINECSVFLVDGSATPKPSVQQFCQAVHHNSKGETLGQNRLPSSTHRPESCAHSLGGGKYSNSSRGDSSQQSFSMAPVQMSLPLCNVTTAQQNYVLLTTHPQAPFLLPNTMNLAMVTTVDGSSSLMFNTHPMAGNSYYTNFSEIPQHLRHDDFMPNRMPCDHLVPRSTFCENGAQNTLFTSTSTKFNPLGSHPAPPVPRPSYLFVSSATPSVDQAMNMTFMDSTPLERAYSNQKPASIPLVNTSRSQFLMSGVPLNAELPRKCANVHSKMAGVARYIPYVENATTPLTGCVSALTNAHSLLSPVHSLPSTSSISGLLSEGKLRVVSPALSPAHHGDVTTDQSSSETPSFFFQMFPCELRDRKGIINRVITAVCGADFATVISVEHRSETSFIASVRTRKGNNLISKLRCRVLMDRLGFWYADTVDQYRFMKKYCETIRRLPQQDRHIHTEGLPCMPLVVELSRSMGREYVPSDEAPPCFDQIVPMATVERHRSHYATRMNLNTVNSNNNNRHCIGINASFQHSSFAFEQNKHNVSGHYNLMGQ